MNSINRKTSNNDIMKRMENTIEQMNRFRSEFGDKASARRENNNTYDRSPGRIINK